MIRDSNGLWLDTDVFREEAIRFEKHGYYCNAPENTHEWSEYWKTQLERCDLGYEVDGVRITGNHYNYLNFCQIKLTDDSENKGSRKSNKQIKFPTFWDGDYDFFWSYEIAEKGISKEDYHRLNLKVEIQEDFLDGGRYLICAKARRKGYSYKTASICANIYNTRRNSLVIIGAGQEKFAKGNFKMVKDYLNFYNKHCPGFRKQRLIDTKDHILSGFYEEVNGVKTESGFKSEIICVTFKDNADAARGKDATLVVFEEAGAFDNLKDSFYATDDTLRDGKYISGMAVLFGTSGDMTGGGTIDFSEMFYNPEEFNLLPFKNIWDKNSYQSNCGFFHASYMNMVGFVDKQGNSDTDKSLLHIDSEIAKRKKSGGGSTSVRKYLTENPRSPGEAFSVSHVSIFPALELENQLKLVKSNNLHLKYSTVVNLYRDETGRVKAKPDYESKLKPIWSKKIADDEKQGAVVIYEFPVPNAPKGLYKIGYDPYRQDQGTSLASIIVYKSNSKFPGVKDQIVAIYRGRTKTTDDCNRIAELLTEFYQTELMYENEVPEVKTYFQRRKKLHLLAVQPDRVISKNVKNSKVARVYGCHMNDTLKGAGESYTINWLTKELDFDENGDVVTTINKIYDPVLLEELIQYNRKGNFDSVMALFQVMFQIEEEDLEKEYKSVDNEIKFSDELDLIFKKNR